MVAIGSGRSPGSGGAYLAAVADVIVEAEPDERDRAVLGGEERADEEGDPVDEFAAGRPGRQQAASHGAARDTESLLALDQRRGVGDGHEW